MKKLLLLITLLFATSTFADELQKYDFQWMHVPVVCGTSPEVMRYLEDNNFKLESISGTISTGDMVVAGGAERVIESEILKSQ